MITAVRRAITALLAAGVAAQVVVWTFLVPAFGGIDEYDHAFRASSVAHGQLVVPPAVVTRGGGGLIRVDPEVVRAAGPECLAKRYTRATDCLPGPTQPDGTVLMPSGAGRYSPVHYLLVGWAGRVLPGDTGLFAQRLLTGALGVLLVGVAAALVLRWRRPAAGLLGLAVAITPVMVYSFATNAPNGPEMAAGVLWWVALVSAALESRRGPATWWSLACSGILLGTVRPLGPLWMVGSLLAVAVAAGVRARPWRRPSWPGLATAVVVGVASLAGIAWTLFQQVLEVPQAVQPSGPPSLAEGAVYATWTAPLTMIEVISENPGRGIAPPPLLLAGWTVAFTLLAVRGLGLAWHRVADDGRRRVRLAALLVLVMGIAVAWVIQVATYQSRAWQGRYELPLYVGVPLLLGVAALSRRFLAADALIIGLSTTVAQVASVDFSARLLAAKDPTAASGVWTTNLPALWTGSVLGGVLLTAALVLAARCDGGALGWQPGGDPAAVALSQEPV